MKCLCCGVEHSNPKYCSMSCAAKVRNRTNAKPLTNRCKTCSTLIYASRVYCDSCNMKDKDMTIKDACIRNDANRYNKIRVRARVSARKANLLDRCFNCGYDKHVECCHIKDIASFPEDAMISEVNHHSNLVGLCPNCHWEFDNHLLKISGTPGS